MKKGLRLRLDAALPAYVALALSQGGPTALIAAIASERNHILESLNM